MKKMGAVRKIKEIFVVGSSFTYADIKKEFPEIDSWEISMALNYFVNRGLASREMIDSGKVVGKSKVWRYTYNAVRQAPK